MTSMFVNRYLRYSRVQCAKATCIFRLEVSVSFRFFDFSENFCVSGLSVKMMVEHSLLLKNMKTTREECYP